MPKKYSTLFLMSEKKFHFSPLDGGSHGLYTSMNGQLVQNNTVN